MMENDVIIIDDDDIPMFKMPPRPQTRKREIIVIDDDDDIHNVRAVDMDEVSTIIEDDDENDARSKKVKDTTDDFDSARFFLLLKRTALEAYEWSKDNQPSLNAPDLFDVARKKYCQYMLDPNAVYEEFGDDSYYGDVSLSLQKYSVEEILRGKK